jgi:hypothetical protein
MKLTVKRRDDDADYNRVVINFYLNQMDITTS